MRAGEKMKKRTHLGNLLRRARFELGINQKQFADELGVSAPFISSIELGHKKFPVKKYKALEEFLKRNGEEFLKRYGIDTCVLKKAIDLSNKSIDLSSLSELQINIILELAFGEYSDKQLQEIKSFICDLNSRR